MLHTDLYRSRSSLLNNISSPKHTFQAQTPRGCNQISKPRPVLRKTSEYWYEEEPEYDAITELLPPKRIYLCSTKAHPCKVTEAERITPGPEDPGTGSSFQEVHEALEGVAMTCGFTSSSHAVDADTLWQSLGQGGAPYFRKLRTRATLTQLEDVDLTPSQVAEACDGLWQELCGQSWKVELDYGLATASSPLIPITEHLLVVASSVACTRLGASLGQQETSQESTGPVTIFDFSGWNLDGGELRKLESWRELHPLRSYKIETA